MQPRQTLALDEIDLSDIDGFWTLPLDEREGAFLRLRTERPIAWFPERDLVHDGEVILPAGRGFHAVTRHAHILEVSRQPELFCSGRGAVSVADLPADLNEFYGSMISMDDPRHARLRRIVSRGFTPRMLDRLEGHVHEVASGIVDGVVDRSEPFDLVAEVSARLPLTIICEMMGIPRDHYDLVLDQTNIVLSMGDPEFVPEGTNPLEAFLNAGMALAALMGELAHQRLAHPTDDLTSALLHAEVEGEALTQEELASFFILLCTAGNETTRNAISHGVWLLSQHPDQRSRWAGDFEGLARTAVEEVVRVASPVGWMRRTVTRDGVRLGDHTFAEGDKVLLFYWSANRDADVFDRPFEFDVARNPNDHVGFGGPGPHFCLGAHLARREITVMFRELFSRGVLLDVVGEPELLRSSFVNGIKRIYVQRA